jgi:ADP-ribose pyrophosphatase
MTHLIDMLPSPGMTDSVTSIYLATDCTPADRQLHGPEEQHSELIEVPLSEALAMIEDGRIGDAKTVVGLLLADRHWNAVQR